LTTLMTEFTVSKGELVIHRFIPEEL